MISSASRAGTLLVVGSGPNIGVSTATLFAQKKFDRIALISRSSSRLQTDKSTILSYLSSSTIPSIQFQIETWAVDVTEKDKFEAVLEQVGEWSKAEDMGIGCILFNAARVDFSSICGGFEEKELVYDFMTTTTALYTVFTWFLALSQGNSPSTRTPCPPFLVTNSLLWANPIPQMFSLSLVKAAQRNLVLSLQKAYPEVHIALLNIGGQVTPDSKYFSPQIVAEKLWEVYQSGIGKEKTEWQVDVNILGE